MWRVLSLAAPSLNLSPDYDDLKYDRTWPWSVKPDKLVTRQTVLSWYREWYAGTPFDTTKGLAAGYGGTPDRFDLTGNVPGSWERTIALFRTNFVLVQELHQASETRPREVAGVLWFAAGPAHYSPFVPVPSGLKRSLPSLTALYPWKFLKDSMNWACRKVMTIAQVRFDFMHPIVARKQQEMELAGAATLAEATKRFAKTGEQKDFDQAFVDHSSRVLEAWHDLADEMVFGYSDNHQILNTSVPDSPPPLGYPAGWLRAVGLPLGPPAVPPIRPGQCPNWDTGCSSSAYYDDIAGRWCWRLPALALVLLAVIAACRFRRPAKALRARELACPYSQL